MLYDVCSDLHKFYREKLLNEKCLIFLKILSALPQYPLLINIL